MNAPSINAVQAIGNRQYAGLQCHVKLPTPKQLFSFMIEMLVAKGIARYYDADSFRKMALPKGLFLWIPPRPKELGPDELMNMVGSGGKNHLDSKQLENLITAPAGPYIMSTVMDGSECLGLPPAARAEWRAKKSRSPFTWYEGIIHAMLFFPFLHHNLMLGASRYETGAIPCINMTGDPKPYLYAANCDFYNVAWGTPSCAKRLTSACREITCAS